MKTLYSAFKTDKNLEQNGVILDFAVARLTCRRAGNSNRKFNAVFNEMTAPHKRAITNGTFPREKSEEIMMRVYARSVVVGWSGPLDEHGNETPFMAEDENGNPVALPFNEENFVKVMKDLPDFWAQVVQECDRHTNFQREVDADGQTLGN